MDPPARAVHLSVPTLGASHPEPPIRRSRIVRIHPAVLALAGALAVPLPAAGQARPWASVGAHAILAYTRNDPVPFGETAAELKLVQPMLFGRAGVLGGRLVLVGTVNLEGETMPDGELSLGAWGEGYVDRRHPHTYVHEAMASLTDRLGPTALSLSLGKGFVPFGTDDPMSRPTLRYPVNHHLSQVLERWVAAAGLAIGPATLEAALFNGDEPERPGQWPRLGGRFGDSQSLRLLLAPIAGVELQGSHAQVRSPEHRPGAGTDQFKWSLSARWDRPLAGHPAYGLVEWARTSEADGFFIFRSLLAEGAWGWGPGRLYYRFERTERPEEERTTANPFRSQRPHLENSILGITRWTIHTAGVSRGFVAPGLRARITPFVEGSYATARPTLGVFDPQAWYGGETFWALSVGLRLGWGDGGDPRAVASPNGHRMGRYGVAAAGDAMGHHSQH